MVALRLTARDRETLAEKARSSTDARQAKMPQFHRCLPALNIRRALARSGFSSNRLTGNQSASDVRGADGDSLAITSNNNLGPLGYGIKYADRVEGVDVYRDGRDGFDPAIRPEHPSRCARHRL